MAAFRGPRSGANSRPYRNSARSASTGCENLVAGAERVVKAPWRACNGRQRWSAEPPRTGRGVCRSLERTTALRVMEDHDRLLHSAEGGIGMGSAVRNRWTLAATCFMVALGLLLCTGRASLAQQQARVPDPSGPAAPHGLAGQGPEGVPVAQSRPAAPRAEQ